MPTEVLRSDTFEQWRQKTNTISSDLGTKGDLSANITANGSLVTAINELQSDIGVVGSLSTFTATDLVSALNELKTGNTVTISGTKTFSSNLNLSTGLAFTINGTSVLNATTLGSGVINSSLTSVGTIGTGVWQGSVIASNYGGTGVNNEGRTITLNAGNLTLIAQSAGSTVTVPSTGTLATLAGPETLTNKVIAIGNNSVSGTLAQFNAALSDDDFAALATAQTLTNKTIALGSNSISGTLSQFNAALTDDDFAALAAAQTLTNKSLTDASTFIIDDAAPTKRFQFQASSITAGQTRILTIQDKDGTVATTGDTMHIGTTAVTLSRGSGNLALTGISSVTLPGSTSGTILVQAVAAAGSNTITLPAITGTVVTTGDTGTVTNTMLAGSIANAKLVNSSVTYNGVTVALGASGTITANTTNALTIGDGLSGGSFNGSAAVTIAADSTIARRADTHFIGTTSVALNRASANQALTGISSVQFPSAGTQAITISPASTNVAVALVLPANAGTLVSTGDTGTVTNTMLAGSIANNKLVNSAVTVGTTSISLGASSTTLSGLTSVTSTAFSGNLTGNVTGDVSGNAGTSTKLATARAINGVNFDGTQAITVTAAAGTLTGTTLNATVTGSSLTSVGTIATGTWNGSVIGTAYTQAKIISVSQGTGVTVTEPTAGNLSIAIGQSVATTANPTFAGATLDNVRIGITTANTIDTSSGDLVLNSTSGVLTISNTSTTVNGTFDTLGKTQVKTALSDASIVLSVQNTNLAYTNGLPYVGADRFTVKTDGSVEIKGDLIVRGATTISGTATISANFNTLTNKPSPVIGVSMTGDVTGSSNITLTELGAGTYTITVPTTIAANSVALGADTTGNYVASISGDTESVVTGGTGEGSTPTLSIGSAIARRADTTFIGTTSIALNRTSAAQTLAGISIDGNAATVTNGIYTTGTYSNPTWLTALDQSKISSVSIAINAGTGISGGGTFNNLSGAVTITNSDRGSSQNIFKNIAVAGQSTVVADSNDDTVTLATDGSLVITTNATTDTITIVHADTSSQASVDNSNGLVIQDVTLDTYGHVTGLGSVDLDNRYVRLSPGVGVTQTVQGNLILSGDLTVNGTTTTVNSTTVEVADLNILLAKNATTAAAANGAGFTIGAITGGSPTMLYTNSSDRFVFNRGIEGSSIVRTGGTSSQFLKADGTIDSTSYLPSANAAASVANALTVGSGLTLSSGTTYNGSAALTISHTDTSSAANLAASGRTYVTGLTFDTFGHVTGYTTGTETVVDTNTTYTNGTGLTLTGTTFALADSYGDTKNPYAAKNANVVLAGPATGAAAAPTFRALVAADIPTLNQNTTGSAGSLVNALTIGTGLGGVSYNGSSAVTITNTDKGSDQNIFKNVALSGTGTNSITCVADTNNDTLTLSASSTSGISISADATTDTITFTNTGVTGITANLVPSGGSFGGAGTINFTGTANQVHLNSSGSTLTFSAPQNIHTGATPTFAGMTLSGLTGYLKANGGSALTASSTIPSTDISNSTFVDLSTSQAASGVKTFNNAVLCKESLEIHNFNLVNGLWFMKSDSTYPYRVILTGNNISHLIGGTSVYTLLFQNNNGSLSLKANGTVEASSTVQATGFKTASGTSAQFLKADGSVDSTTYLSGTVAVANGGTGATTLTGYVKGNGTSAFTASSTVPWSDVSGAPSFLTTAVTSLTGTTNQVTVSASTGSVTLSLPQSIHTGATVQFDRLGIGSGGSPDVMSGLASGEIRARDNITAYYASDERLKTNIKKIDNALEKVSQIDGVIYDWNEQYKNDHGGVDGYFIRNENSGVIAQQVEKVFPNVVADRSNGFKAVRYELLVPLLIEAIKDLKAEIEALKAQK